MRSGLMLCALASAQPERRTWLGLGRASRPWRYERVIATSCGLCAAASNAGRWKPRRLLDGVATMARSARRFTDLPVLFLAFDDEDTYETCQEAHDLRATNASRRV